jgi:hypothetical protein
MLQKQTVEPKTLELLNRLMHDSVLDKFILVGGTSISLQLGHRVSVDLDLFSNETFDEQKLTEHLRTNYHFELDFIDKETVKGEIDGVKIDCIAHKYPWVSKPIQSEEVRLAHYSDLAAMKLNAIIGNGTRLKDFIDIAYLSKVMSLNQMINAYHLKYNSNGLMALKAIVYFEDINFAEPIRMLPLNNRFDWKKIEKQLLSMTKHPDKIF